MITCSKCGEYMKRISDTYLCDSEQCLKKVWSSDKYTAQPTVGELIFIFGLDNIKSVIMF